MRSCLTCGGRNMRSSSDSGEPCCAASPGSHAQASAGRSSTHARPPPAGRGRASPRRVSGERAAESSSFYHVDYATYDKLKCDATGLVPWRPMRTARSFAWPRSFASVLPYPSPALHHASSPRARPSTLAALAARSRHRFITDPSPPHPQGLARQLMVAASEPQLPPVHAGSPVRPRGRRADVRREGRVDGERRVRGAAKRGVLGQGVGRA